MDVQDSVTDGGNGAVTHLGDKVIEAARESSKRGARRLADAMKGENPIMTWLGKPTFVPGNGKEYQANEGWGQNKKPVPNKWNRTLASVHFTGGEVLNLSISIYQERAIVPAEDGDGREEVTRTYVSLGKALTYDKKSALATAHVRNFQSYILQEYDRFLKAHPEAVQPTAIKSNDPTERIARRKLA